MFGERVKVLLKEESSYKRRSAMPCNAETCGEDEDEEGVKEEESPAFNMMVLPSAELGRVWLVILLLLFTFESLLDDIFLKGRTDLRGRLEGDLSASRSLAARWTVCR